MIKNFNNYKIAVFNVCHMLGVCHSNITYPPIFDIKISQNMSKK